MARIKWVQLSRFLKCASCYNNAIVKAKQIIEVAMYFKPRLTHSDTSSLLFIR